MNNEWIPITKDLPPLHERVLVTTTSGLVNIGTFVGVQLTDGPVPDNSGEYFSEYQELWILATGYEETRNVKAWMSLPEPYKETE